MKRFPVKPMLPHSLRAARDVAVPLRFARARMFLLGALVSASVLPTMAVADEEPTLRLKIRNHQFIPAEVEIPAGEKRMLVIENEDPTVEEFESHALHREKIVPPLSTTNLFIGPLKPGRYEFTGEFNEASAKGAVIAR